MQTVIEKLERAEAYHNERAKDTESTALESGKHSLKAQEYTKALSILRSYPQSGEDSEAKPAAPPPTIYVSLDEDGEASWDTGRYDGDEVAPEYVAVAARKLVPYGARTPRDEVGLAAVDELHAALARWKSVRDACDKIVVMANKVRDGGKLDGAVSDDPPAMTLERLQAARDARQQDAMDRWKAEKEGKQDPRTKTLGDTIADDLNDDFRPLTRKQSEDMDAMFGVSPVNPIAPEFTPPEMQDDPRYLRILITLLVADRCDDDSHIKHEETAASIFNTLFPKP